MPNQEALMNRLRLGLVAVSLSLSCQPPSSAAGPSATIHSTSRRMASTTSRDELEPVVAYCVPHVPSTDKVAFSVDYDGSDGSREPRFADPPPPPDLVDGFDATPVVLSSSARDLCQAPDKPSGRRYLLRVPINAEPRRLDEYVRYGARRGFDQPIFKANQAIVAGQIENTEYAFSPKPSVEVPEYIGTLTIESDANGDYELRARLTNGQDQSTPIGIVKLPAKPNMNDCDSKRAESLLKLCAHVSRPCERATLVGVNDIGALLAVLGYVQAVANLESIAVAFQQRDSSLDDSPYLDASFRRTHRVKRFFAAMKPEIETRKLLPKESLATGRIGLQRAVPKVLADQIAIATDTGKRLKKKELTEIGKRRHCEQPARSEASLVVDGSDRVRVYSERINVTDKAEMLLRAYYDEALRLRLVISSETTDSGDAWDAYLVLGEDGCPISERILTSAAPSPNMLHWELKQLKDPRARYSEPLCIGQLP